MFPFLVLLFLVTVEIIVRLDRRFRPVPILIYHFIDGEGEKRGLSVSLSRFEQHLMYLLQHNFRLISLEEFVKSKQTRTLLPGRCVVITFDDGDEAFYTKVYPFLLRYQLPATVFVVTEWIGRAGYLNWEQLRSMSRHLVTVGSHTVSHRYLPDLELDAVRRELVESKRVLEEKLDRLVNFLSYPVGGFNREIVRLARETGYLAACTTNRGRNFFQQDLFVLKRVKMTEKTTQSYILTAKFSGYYNLLSQFFPKQTGARLISTSGKNNTVLPL